MRTFILLFTVCIGSYYGQAQSENVSSKTKRAVATYTGNSTQGYYFINDLNQSSMLFNIVRPNVLEKFDLTARTYIQETFRIYYNTKIVDDKKELTIINLELLDFDDE